MSLILKIIGWLFLIYGGFGVINSLLGSHYATTILDLFIAIGGHYTIKWAKARDKHQMYAVSSREADEYRAKVRERKNKEQDYQNKVCDAMTKSLGCNPEMVLWDGEVFSLGIDYVNEKICIVNNDHPKLFNFSDIIKVEFMQSNQVSGGGGRIYDTGGNVASISSMTIYNVKIIINDRQHPTYTITFKSNGDADYWYGTLTAITSR